MTVWGKLLRTRLPLILAPRSSQTWCTLNLFLIRKNLFGSLPWLLIGWVLSSISSRVCFSSQGRKSRVIKGLDGVICHLPWSPEAGRSSTWRELQALHVCLSSFSKTLSGCAVQWFTDNRYIPSIIRSGSMKCDLHQLALSTF